MSRGQRVGFRHSEETKQKIRIANIGKVYSEEYKTKMSESTKRHWNSPAGVARREHYSEMLQGERHPMYGRRHNEQSKEKMREAKLGRTLTEEHKAKIGLASKRIGISKETRIKMGNALKVTRKEQWQDSEYVIKQVKARGAKPNKSEKLLWDILSLDYPQFQYNGDGRLGIALAGLVPDFVNINGQKQVIELYGELYHNPDVARRANREIKWRRTEEGRIQSYKSVGWDCLIIWGLELKSPTLVKAKIVEFVGK